MNSRIISPERVIRSAPHLQVLGLRSIPETRGLRFIPDVNDKFGGYLMGLDIRDQLIKVFIPHSPVSIIARPWSIRGLRQISTPEVT